MSNNKKKSVKARESAKQKIVEARIIKTDYYEIIFEKKTQQI
jgi:hypothetical protein